MKLKTTRSFILAGKVVNPGLVIEVMDKNLMRELVATNKAFAVAESTPLSEKPISAKTPRAKKQVEAPTEPTAGEPTV